MERWCCAMMHSPKFQWKWWWWSNWSFSGKNAWFCLICLQIIFFHNFNCAAKAYQLHRVNSIQCWRLSLSCHHHSFSNHRRSRCITAFITTVNAVKCMLRSKCYIARSTWIVNFLHIHLCKEFHNPSRGNFMQLLPLKQKKYALICVVSEWVRQVGD